MASRLRRLRRIVAWAALVYAVYALLVVYLVPPIARHLTQTRLGALLQRPVTVTSITLNPFTLCLRVRGLEVWERDGETLFVGATQLEADLDLVLSALQRGLVLSAVTIDGPHAIVVRRQDLSFNFSDLLRPRPAAAAAPPAPSSGTPRFSVSNIQIRQGWFYFRDEVVKAQQRLTGVHLSIAAVSSLPNRSEVYVQPAFRAQLNGREIVFDCQTKPFADSQESSGDISLHDLDLTALAHYLPEPRNFDLSSGWLDIDLKLAALHVLKQKPAVSVRGSIALRDLRLTGRDGLPMAGVESLQVSFLPVDLMQREVHLSRILCRAPFLRLARDAQGALLLPRLGAAPVPGARPASGTPPLAPVASPAAPPPITADVDEIVVQEGRLEFSDAAVSPAFRTTLAVQLGVTGLTTRPERPIQVRFEVATEAAETLAGAYTVTLLPLVSVAGTTTAKDIRLPKYMPYLETTLDSAITRGTLAANVEHQLALPGGAPPVVKVSDLDLSVNDFCLATGAEQAPVVTLQELALTDVTADLGAREAVVGAVVARGGQVQIQRFKDGSLNLQKLLRARPAAAPAAPNATAPATAPWTVSLREAALTEWAVALHDGQPSTAVQVAVDDITLNLKDLSTRAGQKGTLALGLRLNQSAALAVAGSFSVQPLAVDLSIKLTDLALKDFQGYVPDHLKLLISDGAVETDLKVVLGPGTAAGMDGTVDGSFALRRFVSVDQAHAEDFVKARELALRGMHVVLRPLAVRLDEVALSGLDTALTVKPDGSLNLMSVLGTGPVPATAAAPPVSPAPAVPPAVATPGGGNAVPLEIGTIRLDGCGVVFTDQQRTPNYRVTLGEVAGTITAFSLGKPTPAQIDLAGRFNGQAPFTLKATLADVGPRMTLTAATVLKDFELSPVTPYSGRYVGYAVQKGKLNFDLEYTLNQRQLVAEHKVLIDQFAFGQKIESPDAVDLPVRLAVALLKDRKGQISLNVPVRGSLDDPKFSILRIVLKVLRDLVAKAATAPFAMLGALVGGGEELSFVDFGPGNADLDEAGTKKLDALAKALLDRPELQVETGATVDLVSDREALVRQAVLRQIKTRKLADLVKAGQPAGSVDELSLSAAERDACLLAIYRETLAPPPPALPPPPPTKAQARAQAKAKAAAKTPQPPVPQPAEPTPAEIEQLLMARTTVTDQEVLLLAGRRAARVREFLTTTGQVPPERVFVLDSAPPAAAGTGAPGTPLRQARMSLR